MSPEVSNQPSPGYAAVFALGRTELGNLLYDRDRFECWLRDNEDRLKEIYNLAERAAKRSDREEQSVREEQASDQEKQAPAGEKGTRRPASSTSNSTARPSAAPTEGRTAPGHPDTAAPTHREPAPRPEAEGAISGRDTATLGAEKPSSAPDGGKSPVAKSHIGGRELTSFMKVTRRQLEYLDSLLRLGQSDYPIATRDFFLHVLSCQTMYVGRYDDGVPVPKQKIERLLGAPRKTELVWRPLVDVGILQFLDYMDGVCRRFLVEPSVRHEFVRAGAEDRKIGSKARYNPFAGSPTDPIRRKRTRSTERTLLTFDGRHSWKDRSTLIYDILKYFRASRALVNLSAYSAYVESLEDQAKRARNRALRSRNHRNEAAAQRAEAVWAHEERILQSILNQGPVQAKDMPEGIYQYSPAYEVQEISGRLSMKGGGAQNASRLGKAAMYSNIPGLYNWDIKSSQTAKLIEEFEDAIRQGANLNISVLTEYAGKDVLAEEYGISREVFKRAEHAPKFGASFFFHSFAAALRKAEAEAAAERNGGSTHDLSWNEHVRARLRTMPKIASEIADDESIALACPEEVYEILRSVYGAMATEIARWRDWLVKEHWQLYGQSGSVHGRFVINPCGIAFSLHEYDASRWGSKYATSRLQGAEAAFIHHLTLLGPKYGFESVANEHDGIITVGNVPLAAVREARERSGFRTAELEEKPFAKAPRPDALVQHVRTTRRGSEADEKRADRPSLPKSPLRPVTWIATTAVATSTSSHRNTDFATEDRIDQSNSAEIARAAADSPGWSN